MPHVVENFLRRGLVSLSDPRTMTQLLTFPSRIPYSRPALTFLAQGRKFKWRPMYYVPKYFE
jgi:hypothetical protein